jgi:hypothetical protein
VSDANSGGGGARAAVADAGNDGIKAALHKKAVFDVLYCATSIAAQNVSESIVIVHIANQLNLIIQNAVFQHHFQEECQKRRISDLRNHFYRVSHLPMKRDRQVSRAFRLFESKS